MPLSQFFRSMLIITLYFIQKGKGSLLAPGADVVYLAGSVIMISLWGTEYMIQNPNSQQSADWVANDERRHVEDGLHLYVHIDHTQIPSNLDTAEVIEAITNAVNTWDNVQCTKNKFNLTIKTEYNYEDIGYAEYMLSQGESGSNVTIGDIVFGGFLPPHFFNNEGVLGNESVTATTVLFDFNGDMFPSRGDIAFAEIYFNDYFSWDILDESVVDVFDIETVALHELGHALSQSHFHPPGKVLSWTDDSKSHGMSENDKNHVVMAPLYFGVNHDLEGVDIGGHCAKWANWGSGSKSAASYIESLNEFEGVDNRSLSPSPSSFVQSLFIVVIAGLLAVGLTVYIVCLSGTINKMSNIM